MSLVEFLLYIVMTMKYSILGGTELCPAQPSVTFVGTVLDFDQIIRELSSILQRYFSTDLGSLE